MVTYDYKTGKVERDFKFKRYGEICTLRGLIARIGGHSCLRCPFYAGTVNLPMFTGFCLTATKDNYVKCMNDDAMDSPNIYDIEHEYNEQVMVAALHEL
ncbi:MAG: hypothetical protein J6Y37_02415 [Paludibacteraceae bacterium]|nr:hypothetical protein [Paludibacteraceae bacterium]